MSIKKTDILIIPLTDHKAYWFTNRRALAHLTMMVYWSINYMAKASTDMNTTTTTTKHHKKTLAGILTK